ncbi:MAG: alpha/beta fold hydrolase [Candidatus Iainarchaeum archaeon]|uniref:Alpha/beta fold hydrolase n=1 Tax=Candidatus Iainarchaeum sp. TaxID=3101447 RepID=A0A7T9DJ89_9ARCH|nr:MAG: alpha/beta fold hydrolase [Candidatus Diapherotrites archaeon]
MRKVLVLGLLALLVLSGCVIPRPSTNADVLQGVQVEFGGADGFKLIGTRWDNPDSTRPPLILVHELGSDRHSLDDFAAFAFANGFSVLSFDMRGHGESRPGNATYLDFTPADWQLVAGDIQAARDYLNVEKVLVVGASIGANAALNYGADESSCAGVVLLSPGLDYRGLTTLAAAQSTRCPMLIVASQEDHYAAQSSQTLFTSATIADKQLLTIEDAGHGARMFDARQTLKQEVLDWLNAHA